MAKIAIIDDDPDIIEAVTILLESKNYEVVSARNVEAALKLVINEKPDLIVLDVMIDEPDDGFYLANKYRKEGVSVPIIMLTSIAKVTGYEFGQSSRLPIEEFLEKPVQPSILAEKIIFHLQKAKGE